MSLSISIRSGQRERVAGSQDAISLSLFHLHHLLAAGVGLGEALGELYALESNRRMRQVWHDVSVRVKAGQSLSEAMASRPRLFGPLVVALIRAGEVNGQLANACESSRELLEWNRMLQSRMVTVLVYPVFALLVLLLVLVFLFVSVVPSLETFLGAGEAGLAWHTRILLAVSDWMGQLYLPLSAGLSLLVVGVIVLRQCSVACALAWDRFTLHLPVIGQLVCELSLSRYSMVCGQLYRSGIELEQSLAISESLVSNSVLRQALTQARVSMVAGASLGDSLSGVSVIPGSFRRLLAAGESAGALGQALVQAGEQRKRHAQHLIERVERLVGPVTLLVIGASLMWIVISVLAPVYDSAINAVMQA